MGTRNPSSTTTTTTTSLSSSLHEDLPSHRPSLSPTCPTTTTTNVCTTTTTSVCTTPTTSSTTTTTTMCLWKIDDFVTGTRQKPVDNSTTLVVAPSTIKLAYITRFGVLIKNDCTYFSRR